jgi:hypothetical protein
MSQGTEALQSGFSNQAKNSQVTKTITGVSQRFTGNKTRKKIFVVVFG